MPERLEKVIEDFFESWGNGTMVAAFEKYVAGDARWLNSGLPDWVGKAACMALAAKFAAPFPTIQVDNRSLTVRGDAVLTERLDRLVPADGSASVDVEVAGSFRLLAGKIHYWYDYFDPRPFVAAFGG
jgi:limonene-1,2-epoxide hydrolase